MIDKAIVLQSDWTILMTSIQRPWKIAIALT